MQVELTAVLPVEKETLRNLLEKYNYEFSQYDLIPPLKFFFLVLFLCSQRKRTLFHAKAQHPGLRAVLVGAVPGDVLGYCCCLLFYMPSFTILISHSLWIPRLWHT